MSYRSQSQSRYDRAISHAHKLRDRLGFNDGVGGYLPKPKGMRWATFNKKADEIMQVEAVADEHLSAFLLRLDPKLAKQLGYH